MSRLHNSRLTPFSKKLRREMTKEERHVWFDFLRELPLTVHRQMVIGAYIVDFCIPQKKLVIELDGFQHGETKTAIRDRIRDTYLEQQGYRVLRYSNHEINTNFDNVCIDIWNWLYPDGDAPAFKFPPVDK